MSILTKEKTQIDMLNGPILPTMIKLAMPLVFSQLMTKLLHTADMIVVGKFVSDSALAAVGAAGTPMAVVTGFIAYMAVGADACCAHAFGSRDSERIKKTIHTVMAFALLVGLFTFLCGFSLSGFMVDLMKVPDELKSDTLLYMRITYCGALISVFFNYGSAIMKANGDVKRPVLYITLAGIVNVVLNVIFVCGFGMSVEGVALATVLSYIVSSFLAIRTLVTANNETRLVITKIRLHSEVFKDILKIGVPSGMRTLLYTAASFFVDRAVNSINNADIIAGSTASANIEGFVRHLLPVALYSATVVMVGQNYGARNYKRIVKVERTGILAIVVSGLVFSLGAAIFSSPLLRIYISEPEAIHYGTIRMWIITSLCFFDVLSDTLTGCMQTCKHSLPPTIISIFSICVFRIIWVFTAFRAWPRYEVILACYPISYILSVTILGIMNIIILRKVKAKFAAESELALS